MDYKRMPIEIESPEQLGYENVKHNLAESSVYDCVFEDIRLDLNKLKLCYGDHLGKPELRELIAKDFFPQNKDQVLITAGAAAALFIVSTTLLEKDSHLIVVRPNYATNIETPRAIGCETDFIDLRYEHNFSIDPDAIIKKIKPNTKLISITHPHNPTGAIVEKSVIMKLADACKKHNCKILVDETYRDINMAPSYPIAASLDTTIISVSSVSKAYGLPGIRIGWLISQDEVLFEKFLAAKEQIFICNSVLDEEIALQYMLKKDEYFGPIGTHIKNNLMILKDWLAREKRMEAHLPHGGVVCFPRIKNGELIDTKRFYHILNHTYKTYVGPGHWFEMPDHYMRIGFGWPQAEEFRVGLENISLTLNQLNWI